MPWTVSRSISASRPWPASSPWRAATDGDSTRSPSTPELGLGVVVAEEVEDAVDGEQVDLGLAAVAGLLALARGDGRRQHEVAEHARARARRGRSRGGGGCRGR